MLDVVRSLIYEYDYDVDDMVRDRRVEAREVQAAIDYCRQLRCLLDRPKAYCSGCVLRTLFDRAGFDEWAREAGVECADDQVGLPVGSDLVALLADDPGADGIAGWRLAKKAFTRLEDPQPYPTATPSAWADLEQCAEKLLRHFEQLGEDGREGVDLTSRCLAMMRSQEVSEDEVAGLLQALGKNRRRGSAWLELELLIQIWWQAR